MSLDGIVCDPFVCNKGTMKGQDVFILVWFEPVGQNFGYDFVVDIADVDGPVVLGFEGLTIFWIKTRLVWLILERL